MSASTPQHPVESAIQDRIRLRMSLEGRGSEKSLCKLDAENEGVSERTRARKEKRERGFDRFLQGSQYKETKRRTRGDLFLQWYLQNFASRESHRVPPLSSFEAFRRRRFGNTQRMLRLDVQKRDQDKTIDSHGPAQKSCEVKQCRIRCGDGFLSSQTTRDTTEKTMYGKTARFGREMIQNRHPKTFVGS